MTSVTASAQQDAYSYFSQLVSTVPKPVKYRSESQLVQFTAAELDELSLPTSSSNNDSDTGDQPIRKRLRRPNMLHRKLSSTITVPRDDPNIESEDEEYEEGDARAMSPRRTSEEVDRLEESATQALLRQGKDLQESLMRIVGRVELVREEHEKLEGGILGSLILE